MSHFISKHLVFNFREFRRGNSPASESGSDAWGGNDGNQWESSGQNWESTEFKKSGWDEPDSIETFQTKPKEKKTRKISDGEQWDAPRGQGRDAGRIRQLTLVFLLRRVVLNLFIR